MYHVTLNIHVFGAVNGPSLLKVLRQVPPIERFEHRFVSCSEPTQESVSPGDILILADGADRAVLSAMEGWRKERSVLVLCADGGRQPDERELALVNSLWSLPMSPAVLRFHFTALLKALKARKDAWLSQTYLDTLINNIPPLVWYKDVSGSHRKVNESFCRAVGKTKEQVQDRGHYYIWDIPPEEYRQGEYICLESEEEVMEKRVTCLFDENVKTKYGMRKFKTYKAPIFDEDGETILGTVGMANDVTAYHNMGSELDALIDNVPTGILICNKAWTIQNVNHAVCDLFPVSAELLVGQDYQTWKKATLQDIRPRPGQTSQDATIHRKDQTLIVEFQEAPFSDVFGTHIGHLCLFRDVTLARTYEARITHYANTDALTGLSTRRSFFRQLAKKGLPDAVLFIDVDDFKGVNDQFGHQIGDLALQLVAGAIREIYADAVTARSGGDEFIVAIHGAVTQEALAAAVKALQERVSIRALHEIPCPLSLSVGIACRDRQAITIDELLRRGDMAMYTTKRRGKGGHSFYTPSMELP